LLLVSRVFCAKKNAVPKGRSPESGIEPQQEDVKICSVEWSSESASKINMIVMGYYFTPCEGLQSRLSGDFNWTRVKRRKIYSTSAANGTIVSAISIATYDLANIRMNIMKT
jgi:hypothetical protein